MTSQTPPPERPVNPRWARANPPLVTPEQSKRKDVEFWGKAPTAAVVAVSEFGPQFLQSSWDFMVDAVEGLARIGNAIAPRGGTLSGEDKTFEIRDFGAEAKAARDVDRAIQDRAAFARENPLAPIGLTDFRSGAQEIAFAAGKKLGLETHQALTREEIQRNMDLAIAADTTLRAASEIGKGAGSLATYFAGPQAAAIGGFSKLIGGALGKFKLAPSIAKYLGAGEKASATVRDVVAGTGAFDVVEYIDSRGDLGSIPATSFWSPLFITVSKLGDRLFQTLYNRGFRLGETVLPKTAVKAAIKGAEGVTMAGSQGLAQFLLHQIGWTPSEFEEAGKFFGGAWELMVENPRRVQEWMAAGMSPADINEGSRILRDRSVSDMVEGFAHIVGTGGAMATMGLATRTQRRFVTAAAGNLQGELWGEAQRKLRTGLGTAKDRQGFERLTEATLRAEETEPFSMGAARKVIKDSLERTGYQVSEGGLVTWPGKKGFRFVRTELGGEFAVETHKGETLYGGHASDYIAEQMAIGLRETMKLQGLLRYEPLFSPLDTASNALRYENLITGKKGLVTTDLEGNFKFQPDQGRGQGKWLPFDWEMEKALSLDPSVQVPGLPTSMANQFAAGVDVLRQSLDALVQNESAEFVNTFGVSPGWDVTSTARQKGYRVPGENQDVTQAMASLDALNQHVRTNGVNVPFSIPDASSPMGKTLLGGEVAQPVRELIAAWNHPAMNRLGRKYPKEFINRSLEVLAGVSNAEQFMKDILRDGAMVDRLKQQRRSGTYSTEEVTPIRYDPKRRTLMRPKDYQALEGEMRGFGPKQRDAMARYLGVWTSDKAARDKGLLKELSSYGDPIDVLRDFQTAFEADSMFRTATGEQYAQRLKIDRDNYDLKKRFGAFRKPTRWLREILGALERTGDPLLKGDEFEALWGRLDNDQKNAVRALKREFKALHAIAVDLGLIAPEQKVTSYVTHMWRGKKGAEVLGERMRSLTGSFRYAQERTLPHYKAGIAAGYKPVTLDPFEILRRYKQELHRARMNRDFLDALHSPILDIDGFEKLTWLTRNREIADKGGYKKIVHDVVGGKKYKREWEMYAHPAIAPYVQQFLDKRWDHPMWRGLQTLNFMSKRLRLSFSGFHPGALMESFIQSHPSAVPMGLRHIPIVGAPLDFLLGTLSEAATFGKHPLPGTSVARYRELVKSYADLDAVRHELVLGAPQEWGKDIITRNLREASDWLKMKGPVAKVMAAPVDALRKVFEGQNFLLWYMMHQRMKLVTYYDQVGFKLDKFVSATGREPNPDELSQMKRQSARSVNDAYGGQNWQSHITNWAARTKYGHWWMAANTIATRNLPAMRIHQKPMEIAQFLMLAPDWTLSNLKIAHKATMGALGLGGGKGIIGDVERANRARYFWGTTMLLGLMTGLGRRLYMPLLFPDEEERKRVEAAMGGTGLDAEMGVPVGWNPNGSLARAIGLKQAREITGWFTNPRKTISGKISPALELITKFLGLGGDPWRPQYADWLAAGEQVPMYAKEMFTDLLSPFSFASNNQYMYSLPKSQAMNSRDTMGTLIKCFQAFVDFDHAGIRVGKDRIMGETAILNHLEETVARARANNLPIEKLWSDAMSLTRAFWYGSLLQDVLNKPEIDEAAAERAIKALRRLGVTGDQLQGAEERRFRELVEKGKLEVPLDEYRRRLRRLDFQSHLPEKEALPSPLIRMGERMQMLDRLKREQMQRQLGR